MENVNRGYAETQPTPLINKGGRPNANVQNEKKALAYNLFCRNITRKEIAKQLSVGEKTIGYWAKEWTKPKTVEALTIANLKARLLAMTIDNATPIGDMKSLISVIQQLETN